VRKPFNAGQIHENMLVELEHEVTQTPKISHFLLASFLELFEQHFLVPEGLSDLHSDVFVGAFRAEDELLVVVEEEGFE